MTSYEEIEDIKIKNPFSQEWVESQKAITNKMAGSKESKLVCITFTFLTDTEVLSDVRLVSKNFNADEWEDE